MHLNHSSTMPKPHLSIAPDDFRRLLRLIDGCRDRGDDYFAWMRHYVEELGRILRADAATTGQIEIFNSKKSAGARSGDDRSQGREYFVPSDVDPATLERCRSDARDTMFPAAELVCASRGHVLTASAPIAAQSDLCQVAIFVRDFDGSQFDDYDLVVLHCASEILAPALEVSLANLRDRVPSELAPRVRQVLSRILLGEGDKQIAAKLEISIYTVNQYIKELFARYSVRSRAELMSRWLKRGWKPHCFELRD
jgi:DNA-binding CsgD family transcriptional regulator